MTTGTDASDSLLGGAGEDFIDGGAGNDTIGGGAGSDTLVGGLGNDYLYDSENGSSGANLLQGGAGRDALFSFGLADTLDGGDDVDELYTSSGMSTLRGGGGDDWIAVRFAAAAGVHRLEGEGGDDVLFNDRFDPGNDTLDGGSGNDTLTVSGDGNLVAGGTGADFIDLEAGTFAGASGTGRVYLGVLPQDAQATVDGDIDAVQLSLRTIEEGRSAPEIFGFQVGRGGDRLDLGAVLARLREHGFPFHDPFATGWLRLVQDGPDTRLQVDTSGPAAGSVWRDLAVVRNTEAVHFTGQNFMPSVSPTPDEPGAIVIGTAGNDRLDDRAGIGAGNDSVHGLDGMDQIDGGFSGDDTLVGGQGRDTLRGADGHDVLHGDLEGDAITGDDDSIVGGDGNDVMRGGGGNDVLGTGFYYRYDSPVFMDEGQGNDALYGDDGGDTLTGGSGDDWLEGGNGNDHLDGGAGRDTLHGGDGADVLQGGEWLDGGAADDQLFVHGTGNVAAGGSGADRFVLAGTGTLYLGAMPLPGAAALADEDVDTVQLLPASAGWDAPEIFGFGAGDGGDVLDLAAITLELARGFAGGTDPFEAGVLRFRASGDDALLQSRPSVDGEFATIAVLKQLGTTMAPSNLANASMPHINHAPTGSVAIIGTLRQGETLAASDTLADIDGIPVEGAGAVRYQWYGSGNAIAGATAATLTLTQAQVDRAITLRATYTDLGGATHTVSSEATAKVANVNDALTGTVSISGTAALGARLTAINSLSDPDGVGMVLYRWKADGVVVGSTSASYTVAEEALGKTVTLEADVTDAFGATESVASADSVYVPGGVHGMVYHWKSHLLMQYVVMRVHDDAGAVAAPPVYSSAKGSFHFLGLPENGTYTLAPERSQIWGAGSPVTSADALAALRIAVGINPNADPDGSGPLAAQKVSPYQVIAADVNADGKVTSTDALAILRMAVSAPGAPTMGWNFVPETLDLWDETAGASALTGTNAIWATSTPIPLPSEGKANFVAVLRGDVNGSWMGFNDYNDLDEKQPGYFQLLGAQLGAPTDVWGV